MRWVSGKTLTGCAVKRWMMFLLFRFALNQCRSLSKFTLSVVFCDQIHFVDKNKDAGIGGAALHSLHYICEKCKIVRRIHGINICVVKECTISDVERRTRTPKWYSTYQTHKSELRHFWRWCRSRNNSQRIDTALRSPTSSKQGSPKSGRSYAPHPLQKVIGNKDFNAYS